MELPYDLVLRPSTIPGVGMGVWTTKALPPGLRMGPYEGRIIPIEKMGSELDTANLWEVHDRFGKILFTIDGKEGCSWMRHVKYARHEEEKNLVALQYERNIYYRTGREIPANTELLVWYSNSYAQSLGLPTIGQITADENGVYNCDKCERSFCYPLTLLAHRKYSNCMQSSSNKILWCDECGKVFAWQFSLKAHIALSHTAHRPYECLQCGLRFAHSTMLQAHCRSNHNLAEKIYSCEICHKTFPQSSQLRRHVRTHTGGKPYKCAECGKCFADSTNLRSHNRIHTGERPFKCEYCSRCFAEGSTLKSHIRTHTGEKPFKCQHCGKAFAHLSSHRKHTLTHSRQKLAAHLLSTPPHLTDTNCTAKQETWQPNTQIYAHTDRHTNTQIYADTAKLKLGWSETPQTGLSDKLQLGWRSSSLSENSTLLDSGSTTWTPPRRVPVTLIF